MNGAGYRAPRGKALIQTQKPQVEQDGDLHYGRTESGILLPESYVERDTPETGIVVSVGPTRWTGYCCFCLLGADSVVFSKYAADEVAEQLLCVRLSDIAAKVLEDRIVPVGDWAHLIPINLVDDVTESGLVLPSTYVSAKNAGFDPCTQDVEQIGIGYEPMTGLWRLFEYRYALYAHAKLMMSETVRTLEQVFIRDRYLLATIPMETMETEFGDRAVSIANAAFCHPVALTG